MAKIFLLIFFMFVDSIQSSYCQSKINYSKDSLVQDINRAISLLENKKVLVVLNGNPINTTVRIHKNIDTSVKVIIADTAINKISKVYQSISDIYLDDITSITILDSISAKALYGSGGFYGAVMINTTDHKRFLENTYISSDLKDTLFPITRMIFDKGRSFTTKLCQDKNVIKKNGQIVASKICIVFKDDTTDGTYEKYDYAGDLDISLRYKAIKDITYNGEEYNIIDTRNKCKSYRLLGRPQLYNSIIVNLNESQITNKKKLIEIWLIGNNGIKKVTTIDIEKITGYSVDIDPEVLKISNRQELMFKDSHGGYWRLNVILNK